MSERDFDRLQRDPETEPPSEFELRTSTASHVLDDVEINRVYRDGQGRKLYCPECGASSPEGYPYEVLHDGKPDPDD